MDYRLTSIYLGFLLYHYQVIFLQHLSLYEGKVLNFRSLFYYRWFNPSCSSSFDIELKLFTNSEIVFKTFLYLQIRSASLKMYFSNPKNHAICKLENIAKEWMLNSTSNVYSQIQMQRYLEGEVVWEVAEIC